MIKYLHSFLSVDAPEDLREKIRLTNYIAVVVSLVAFPYIFIFRTYSEDLSNVVILIIASFLTVVVLSKLGYYTFSRFFLLLTTNITATYYAASFGEAAGIQYLFFSYLGLPLIIFDFHKVKQIFFGCLIPVLCILYLEISAYYSPTFVLTSANFQNNIRLTSIFFVSLIIISSLISLIKSLKQSYDALQTAYTDLQAQQNLLEKTWHDSVYAQLTRTIAHELKNPLFEVSMVVGALEKSLDDKETAAMFLASLATTIEELMELLHAMLESGAVSVGEPKEMQISDVMRRVLILAEGSLKKRNIRLHKDWDTLPIILGDPKSYLMVFSNLIVNAMEAMSDDDGPGGDLTIRLKREPLPTARYGISIEIEDSGVGIPLLRQQQLFTAGHSTKAIHERQRGIGLNLVWKLIDQMGGTITVHSDPDTKPGTTFRIVV